MRTLGVTIALVVSGCASFQGTAETYKSAGKQELGAIYLAHHFQGNATDPEARALMLKGFEDALRTLDADYQDANSGGNTRKALGIATRREELLGFARSLGFREFDSADAGALVAESFPRAAKAAVAAVDAAEGSGTDSKKLAKLLRRAMAYKPNDPELNARYRRLQAALAVNMYVRLKCGIETLAECHGFAGKLLELVTEERREFLQVVPGASDRKNAELVVTLKIDRTDSEWQRKKAGTSKQKIPKKNKFQEIVKDKKGKPIMQTVKASYQLFERTTKANVQLNLVVRDLGPSGKELFTKNTSVVEKDTRNYVTWKGDERALGSMAKYGSDASPPKDPRILAQIAAEKIATSVSQELLKKMDGN